MLRAMRPLLALLCCLVVLPLHSASAMPLVAATEPASISSPTLIIENAGQWDSAARFQVWGGPGVIWLAKDAIWLTVLSPAESGDPLERLPGAEPTVNRRRAGANLRLSFEGANPHPTLVPFGPSDSVVSYFIGNDPDQWHPDVPVWTGVRYVDLYPGLDLEISGTSGAWAWRMVTHGVGTSSMTSLQDVRLRVEGAETLTLDGGVLRLQTAVRDVALPLLRAVDVEGGPLGSSTGSPQLAKDTLTAPFTSAVDAAAPAGGPSAMIYSTYLGGGSSDWGRDVAVDQYGRAFVTGYTSSSNYPTTPGAFDTVFNAGQIVVTALAADGSALLYSTFLGGAGVGNIGESIALDGSGRAWVTGHTLCADYPTTSGAIDRSHNGAEDIVVSALSANGTTLVYSTYLGGANRDQGYGIALGANGRIYVTGETESSDYPTTLGAYDTSLASVYGEDIVVSALSAAGSSLVYSTYLGGISGDYPSGIAVDGTGQACIVGSSWSSDYPTTAGSFDPVYSVDSDIVVTKLSANGSSLVYSTFLGDIGWDEGYDVALDGEGRAFITGYSNTGGYPTTPGAHDTTWNGNPDIVVSALSADGSSLVYSTFLGGTVDDRGYGIALDGQGRAYITGKANSSNYPVTADALDTGHNGLDDCVVSVLSASGSSLVYSTYLGGSGTDEGHAIAVGRDGRACVVGVADSANYPTTTGAVDETRNGSYDIVVSALAIHTSTHFAPASEWLDGLKWWAPQNRYPRMTGDVDGDGDDDVVAFNPDPTAPAGPGAYVALSNGGALGRPERWTSDFGWLYGQYNWRAMGDVTGDGKDDIVGLSFEEGIYVGRSTGSGFEPQQLWTDVLKDWGPQGVYPKLVGNPDGDSKDDLVAISPTTGVWVARSSYDAFNSPQVWSKQVGWMSDERNGLALGDVDGDGDDDLVNFRYGEGVFVALSNGVSYGTRTLWLSGLKYWGPDQRYPRLVGDVTGDGLADVVAWNPDSGGWVAVSTGAAFLKPVLWTSEFAHAQNNYYLHTLGDMNGDGRDDAVYFWYEDGVYVALSSWG